MYVNLIFPSRCDRRLQAVHSPGPDRQVRGGELLLLHLHLHQRALPHRHQDRGRRGMRILRQGRIAAGTANPISGEIFLKNGANFGDEWHFGGAWQRILFFFFKSST